MQKELNIAFYDATGQAGVKEAEIRLAGANAEQQTAAAAAARSVLPKAPTALEKPRIVIIC